MTKTLTVGVLLPLPPLLLPGEGELRAAGFRGTVESLMLVLAFLMSGGWTSVRLVKLPGREMVLAGLGDLCFVPGDPRGWCLRGGRKLRSMSGGAGAGSDCVGVCCVTCTEERAGLPSRLSAISLAVAALVRGMLDVRSPWVSFVDCIDVREPLRVSVWGSRDCDLDGSGLECRGVLDCEMDGRVSGVGCLPASGPGLGASGVFDTSALSC